MFLTFDCEIEWFGSELQDYALELNFAKADHLPKMDNLPGQSCDGFTGRFFCCFFFSFE